MNILWPPNPHFSHSEVQFEVMVAMVQNFAKIHWHFDIHYSKYQQNNRTIPISGSVSFGKGVGGGGIYSLKASCPPLKVSPITTSYPMYNEECVQYSKFIIIEVHVSVHVNFQFFFQCSGLHWGDREAVLTGNLPASLTEKIDSSSTESNSEGMTYIVT